jgi:hypothetical protein
LGLTFLPWRSVFCHLQMNLRISLKSVES